MVSICDRVRYVETDMMGVVHHSNYFRWFEMGRVAWLRAAGVELWELMNANIIFPITHVEANYKESALYDDEIEICAEMTAFSRAKMDFTYLPHRPQKRRRTLGRRLLAQCVYR